MREKLVGIGLVGRLVVGIMPCCASVVAIVAAVEGHARMDWGLVWVFQ